MHAHINKCSVKHGLMPVKDPHESCCFFSFSFLFLRTVAYGQGECMMWENMIISLCLSLRCCLYLAHLSYLSALQCLREGRANHEQGQRGLGLVGWSGVGIKRREDMIHGRVGSSRETATDLQSEGRWTGTKALFRQSECSVSCDGWRRSV